MSQTTFLGQVNLQSLVSCIDLVVTDLSRLRNYCQKDFTLSPKMNRNYLSLLLKLFCVQYFLLLR